MDFSQEGIYVLDNLFFTDEARFHLSGYINSQNSGTWSAKKNHMYCMKILPLELSETGIWYTMS